MIRSSAIFSLLLALSLSGCVSVKSVSLTSIPEDREQVVTASGDRFLFLGISFSTSYIDETIASLGDQCPDGKVEGVLTKHEYVNYFLYLFATERVVARGFCR